MGTKVFGKRPQGNRLQTIQKSPNYRNGSFQNLELTPVMREGASYFKMLKDFANKPKTVKPPGMLPSAKFDFSSIDADKPVITWFGHSSYLICSQGVNILVDPVFSGHAGPYSFTTKAFPGSDIVSAADMPEIDFLIITHDHFDHLDYETLGRLDLKIKHIICPLGLGSHLEYWGFHASRYTEFDWWDSREIGPGVAVTSAPSRHFSGRTLKRNQTLWTSYILRLHGFKLYLGGDSGYGTHFKTIGEQYGPFDVVMLECGQYGEDWPHIHMLPEEVVQAAADLNTQVLIPVHWAKFTLSNHAWNDSIIRLLAASESYHYYICTPMIGQPYKLHDAPLTEVWWEF